MNEYLARMLPLEKLRTLAAGNGSVNAHLASRYDLRWHDPAWSELRARWVAASAAWRPVSRVVPFAQFGPGGFADPLPARMASPHREVAEEFVAVRVLYNETNLVLAAEDEERGGREA